jgi:hypothetical protein
MIPFSGEGGPLKRAEEEETNPVSETLRSVVFLEYRTMKKCKILIIPSVIDRRQNPSEFRQNYFTASLLSISFII